MTATQNILRAGVAAQATALAAQNLKERKSKDKPLKDLLKKATTNIVGVPLLQTQSQLIGRLS